MMRQLCLIISIGLIFGAVLPVCGADFFDQHGGTDFFTITDEDGKVISKLASLVSAGDYLITEDDSGYRIISVEQFRATAKYEGKVDLNRPGWVMVQEAKTDNESVRETMSIPVQAEKPKIGLYFTHSEESYVPNSGTHQKKKGDIYRVGETLAESLRKNGAEAVVAEEIHSPRDANSYNRSRPTAIRLLRQRPAILIDLHRDGIPDPDYYNKTVKGEQIAQVRIVVGKQNANRSVNFDFAKALKAKANEMYPGLVKEIFWAKGNYNQDLAPRAILLEFGTHTNSLQRANKAAEMMGDVLASMAGAPAPQQEGAGTQREQRQQPTGRQVAQNTAEAGDQSGGWSSALWLLVIVVVGFIVYALINSEGLGGIKYMLQKFRSKELSGFFGKVPKSEEKRVIKIPPDDQEDQADQD